MYGYDTKQEVTCGDQVEAEPAIQQEPVEQKNSDPNHAEKDSEVDSNQIGGAQQDAGAETQEKFSLAGQKEGDREKIGEHQERDIGFEILAVDRDYDHSLNECQPERSVQPPKQKESKQARTSGDGIEVSSHQEQVGAKDP